MVFSLFIYKICCSVASDHEEDRNRSFHNGKSGKEYKDDEDAGSSPKSVSIAQTTDTAATRKKGTPSKKVDLGAAAHYTGDNSSDSAPKQVQSAQGHSEQQLSVSAFASHPQLSLCDPPQSQPAAPQPASSGLADLLMVDSTPSQPAPTGRSSSSPPPQCSATLPSIANSMRVCFPASGSDTSESSIRLTQIYRCVLKKVLAWALQ